MIMKVQFVLVLDLLNILLIYSLLRDHKTYFQSCYIKIIINNLLNNPLPLTVDILMALLVRLGLIMMLRLLALLMLLMLIMMVILTFSLIIQSISGMEVFSAVLLLG